LSSLSRSRNIRIHFRRFIPISTHSAHLKRIIIIIHLLHTHSPLSPTPALGVALPFTPVAGDTQTVGESTVFAGTIADAAEEEEEAYYGEGDGDCDCEVCFFGGCVEGVLGDWELGMGGVESKGNAIWETREKGREGKRNYTPEVKQEAEMEKKERGLRGGTRDSERYLVE
jgi:hypothetical protein